jgi:tetratricopeptide (TPR) repeat protein
LLDDPAGGNAAIKQKAIVIALGLVSCLACLEAGLRVFGAAVLFAQAHSNALSMRQTGVYRIMCVGESMTQRAYPPFLEQALNGRDMGIRVSVIDAGRSSTDSSMLLSRLEANLDTYHPNMVVAMMGINDYGPHMLYEPESSLKIVRFFKTFRTYRLARIVWKRIARFGHGVKIGKLVGRASRWWVTEFVDVKRNDRAYVELGWAYQAQCKYAEAEAAFKKGPAINPGDDRAYQELGQFYQAQRKFAEAAAAYKKALGINPGNVWVPAGLVWVYQEQGKSAEAEKILKKALEINPRNDRAYWGLGWAYQSQGKYAEAEEAFKKALEMNPGNDGAYQQLGGFYQAQGKFAETAAAYKKALEINPGNDKVYQQLGHFYQVQGKSAEAAAVFKQADEMRLKEYDSVLTDNYRRLQEMLGRRGIQLVCVQYPMRSLAPLKKMFQGRERGVIFVDNEKVFKDAVKRSSMQDYFVDRFGGDFGHCTLKGKELLAETIAGVLRREYFRK